MSKGSIHKTAGKLTSAVAATAVLLLLSGAGQAEEAKSLTPVTMQLDWVLAGPNGGFMVAKEKGFFEEEGLDVTINQGKGSGNTAQLVGAKATDFGFSDGYVVANSISKGADITMVAGIYRRNPAAAIAIKGKGISTPKDLEGKTLALPTGSAQFQQWPAFARGCDVDPSKVRAVNIDGVAEEASLLAGQIDAMAGFAQGSIPALERGGAEVEVFWFADCGVTTVSNGIIVNRAMLTERPELIAPFVRAAVRGFLYARENPDEAVAIVKKHQPAADEEITRGEMELSWLSWVGENTAGKPLGWQSADDWATTFKVLAENGVEQPFVAEEVFTNEFTPEGDEFIPPQK